MDTWELTTPPVGAKVLPNWWVFVTKYTANGKVDKYKGRLVVRGDYQREGIDYGELYAPTVQQNSLRVIIAIATENDYDLHQMDVTGAFLHSHLDETVYMRQPEGFV
jgi:hypothetical protein